MRAAVIANFLGFQGAWFACVLGAAHGQPWVGMIASAALGITHLVIMRGRALNEALLMTSAGVIGYAADSTLVVLRVIDFPEAARLGGPSAMWMVMLWVNLAATLNLSLCWLRSRAMLACAIGAMAGPLAYWSGARLGALTFPRPVGAALIAIAAEWSVAMPLLVMISRRLGRERGDA